RRRALPEHAGVRAGGLDADRALGGERPPGGTALMPGERMRRVNEVLREAIADGVEALGDPGLGFVTVTAVRAASDLSQASVYVSVLGAEKRRARSLRALERARGVLQSRIARELHLKRTPQLSFHYDETLDQAMRLEQLIRREHELVGPDSGMTEITLENDLASVVAAIAAADRVIIATHENPDGDAIGSMTAAAAALRSLGKEVRTYLEPESSVPHEVAFLDMEGLERTVDPDSLEGWTLLALDCGNERRLGAQYPDLLSHCSPVIAESLYVGLVTDTGRFQYRTTSPAALRLGARLVESGVDVHKVFERVF